MKKKNKIILIVSLLILVLFMWATWMNNKAIHDKVFQEKAHKDGTMGWVVQPDGAKEYTLICDYNVMWFPFGRYVASCEGGYFVTFLEKFYKKSIIFN